jgi:hypothetical protein
MLNWILYTNAGLVTRIAIGAVILAGLALVDLMRNRESATRWREYGILLIGAAAAMLYGAIDDLVASRISWEYFYYGKGLDQVLGPHVPPEIRSLSWEACKIGMKSTWSVGLIVAVALLIANNPRRDLPRLPYRGLIMLLPAIFALTAVFAAAGAWAANQGWLTWTSHDLQWLVRDNLFRPDRFLTVYGMNAGGYVGGIVATVATVISIRRQRRR